MHETDLTPAHDERDMTFVEHLGELRRALVISLLAVIVGAGLGLYFYDPLLAALMQQVPYVNFIFVSPAEAFVATLRVAILFGLFTGFPIILRELFWFVGPALSRRQQLLTIPVMIAGYGLFLAGVALSYWVLLPVGAKFLIGFAPSNIKPMISIGEYVGFASVLLFGTGLIFEVPIVLLFLNILGIVSRQQLATSRRYAYFGSFVVSAIITPSVDVFTQSLLAGALIVLFELSLLLMRFVEWGRPKDD